jgi:hypothetical protein
MYQACLEYLDKPYGRFFLAVNKLTYIYNKVSGTPFLGLKPGSSILMGASGERAEQTPNI